MEKKRLVFLWYWGEETSCWGPEGHQAEQKWSQAAAGLTRFISSSLGCCHRGSLGYRRLGWPKDERNWWDTTIWYISYIYILVFHGKCKTEGYSTYSSSSDDWQHVKRQSSHLDVSSALQHSHGCRHWVEGSILSHGTFIRWLETTLKDANSCHGLSLVAYSS